MLKTTGGDPGWNPNLQLHLKIYSPTVKMRSTCVKRPFPLLATNVHSLVHVTQGGECFSLQTG